MAFLSWAVGHTSGDRLSRFICPDLLVYFRFNAHQKEISLNLFEPGYTMSSALANKFNEAQPGLSTAALIEIGLVLFLVAVLVNSVARLLVRLTGKSVN